jgi:hypothetical protein
MWIMGNIIFGTDIAVRKIAMSATGHQEFLPRMRCMIYDKHFSATPARFRRAHQPGRAGSDYDDICQQIIRGHYV